MLAVNAEVAVQVSGIDAKIEKIEKIVEIMTFGVMTTPALVIDGVVENVGKVLSPEDNHPYLT